MHLGSTNAGDLNVGTRLKHQDSMYDGINFDCMCVSQNWIIPLKPMFPYQQMIMFG
jgi:hypothetical protein